MGRIHSFVATALIALVVIACAYGREGGRQGVMGSLGAGMGVSTLRTELPVRAWKKVDAPYTRVTFMVDLAAGFVLSDQIAVLIAAPTWLFDGSGTLASSGAVVTGMIGPKAMLFVKPQAPSLWLGLGVGAAYAASLSEEFTLPMMNGGVQGQVGYEFATNRAIALQVLVSRPDTRFYYGKPAQAGLINVGLTINAIEY